MGRQRKFRVLLAMIALAVIFSALLRVFPGLTGIRRLDGSIGVLLGLYICSHPAANLLDLLLYGRRGWLIALSRPALGVWILLNGLVMAAGWYVLLLGTVRFAAK